MDKLKMHPPITPQLLSLLPPIYQSRIKNLPLCCTHSTSWKSCNSHWLKCNPGTSSYHQSYDLIYIWWHHVPHWRYTQQKLASSILILFVNLQIPIFSSSTSPFDLSIPTQPKNPTKTIGFSPHWHTLETTTVYSASLLDQCLQQRFKPSITGRQIIADNTTADTPLLA